MRCKNCGAENDENRYICDNCGSPLYDEEPEINDNGDTRTFGAVRPEGTDEPEGKPEKDGFTKSTEKKSIVVIAVLAVVLVAIIVAVVLAATANNSEEPETSEESTTVSTTAKLPEKTTELVNASTEKPSTTERTTESTTEETTTEPPTSAIETYSIKLISKGGGTVQGAGTYEDGDNVTITATPDENYVFDGWYSNGTKISSSMTYSFTAAKDLSISAVFVEVETEPEIEEIDGGLM